MALIKRVRRVDWEITRNKDGYRVKTPKGPVVVHLTYSDGNAIKLVTKRLELNGLTEAETNMAEVRKTARTTRTAKAQAAAFSDAQAAQERTDADAEAARQAAEAAAVARASGPYQEPEEVGIMWFAQQHPAPWMRWVWMTPEIAKYLLDHHNQYNRPVRLGRVDHYRGTILRGEWHRTHQGMAMDTRAQLQDGQHRLLALVQAGEEMPSIRVAMAFFVGMPVDNFEAVDEGLNRSPSDVLGEGSYGGTIGTAVRLSLAFQAQSPKRMIRERQTNETVARFFREDPDELRLAARWAVSNYKKAKLTAGPLAAARYMLRRANGPDNRYVEAFFNGLMTGTKSGSRVVLDDDDPRAVTRQFFDNARDNRRRITPIEAMSIIVLAWNNIVEGRRPRFVRFTDDSPIPRITLAKDDGTRHAAINCPSALDGEIGDDE